MRTKKLGANGPGVMVDAAPSFYVVASSGGERALCLVKHDRWTCLIGFGRSRVDTFDAYLDREEEKAIRTGRDFDRDARSMLLYGYEEIPFDPSGRFVLNDDLSDMGNIGDAIFFHGAGLLTLSALLRRAIDYARRYGIGELYGDVLEDNVAMRALCRALGFREAPAEEHVVRFTLPLAAAAAQ